jgi:nucleoside-diphosphate-sugar epimerase
VTRVALVVGATGACAKRLVELLLADPEWSVVGWSRRPERAPRDERFVAAGCDLRDAADVRRAAADCRGVTHVFYTARATHAEGGFESVDENAAMFAHVLDAVVPVARDLAHVHLVEGAKYYGVHAGPYPTPAEEDDPRPAIANFYYVQEDLLRERQRGQRWSWSASRPNVICDFAPERPRNLVPLLGAYAALLAELGEPLHFPGKPGCWEALTEVTDAMQLARAMVFVATSPLGANRAFNVSNGDVFRWQRMWPRLAARFGLPCGDVRPISLAAFAAGKEAVWQRVVRRHGLVPSRVDGIANWAFGDFLFRQDYDVVSSLTRLRQAGFHEVVDTGTMLASHLARYEEARMLPATSSSARRRRR